MVSKQRSYAVVVSVAAVFGLALAACGGSPARLTVPEGAQPGDLLLKACTFNSNTGEYAADCGTLVMPENRDRANSRLIALPVTRIHARSASPAEPIFFLDGGPGESLNMQFKPSAALLANHDVVMLGYRGVDGSSVLDCPEVGQAMSGVGGNLLSDASRANLRDARSRCAQRLQGAGIDLEGYTLPAVAADLEAARAGLGYERANLLARGYGTRIAQIYTYLHPDRVLRSALIGPGTPGHNMLFEPEIIDAQVETYARLCAQDAACSVRTSDLAATMRNVTHNMPERWLLFPIDTGKVRVATFLLLKRTGNAAMVFDAYTAAEQGDPSGLLALQLLYDLEVPVTWAAWGDFYAKSGIDYDPSRDYAADMAAPDSILGSPFSVLIWSGELGWPMTSVPAEFHQVHASDVPTLLVTGSIDTRFPPNFVSEELLPYLSNVQQVVVAEAGHELLDVQREAVERLLTSFYDTGVADDSLYVYTPVNFQASPSAPTLAKLLLGIALLMVAAVSAVAWIIIRRMQRRRLRTGLAAPSAPPAPEAP
jgi:pimeloyl-ACP methyl ester carboxylesterase